MKRKKAFWLLITLALSFALAACASQKGSPAGGAAQTRSQQQAQQQGQQQAQQKEAGAGSSAAQAAQQAGAPTSREQRTGADTTPLGDRVEIRTSWVQVRNKPSQDAAAIALAFGNDRYPVLEQQGDWVRVRLDGNREGWIPVEATKER